MILELSLRVHHQFIIDWLVGLKNLIKVEACVMKWINLTERKFLSAKGAVGDLLIHIH